MPAKPRGRPWGHKPKQEPVFKEVKARRRKKGCCRDGGPLASYCKACPLRPIRGTKA